MSDHPGKVETEAKKEKQRRKRGRPAFVKTKEMAETVRGMIGLHFSVEEVAEFFGKAHGTITKHFSEEIKGAKMDYKAQVAQNIFEIATSKGPGAMAAAALLADVWLGWRPQSKTSVQTLGKDGKPVDPPMTNILVSFVKPPEYPPDPPLETEKPRMMQ